MSICIISEHVNYAKTKLHYQCSSTYCQHGRGGGGGGGGGGSAPKAPPGSTPPITLQVSLHSKSVYRYKMNGVHYSTNSRELLLVQLNHKLPWSTHINSICSKARKLIASLPQRNSINTLV